MSTPKAGVMIALATLFSSNAYALTVPYSPEPWDYIFYTFALCGIGFATVIILAYKEYQWLLYVGFSGLLLLHATAIDGSLAYLSSGNDFVLWVLPFLLTTGIASYGFLMVALRLESPHFLAKFKPLFLLMSVASGLFVISTPFWLGKVPLPTMWAPANLLFFTMIICQVLPPLTWTSYGRGLHVFIRAYPIVVAVFSVTGYCLIAWSSDSSQQDFNTLYRWLLILVAFFSLTIVVWHAFNNRNLKEAAERKAIESAKNEAETQLALLQSEQAYSNAVSIAARHRNQLATVSHDLKQPITALRVAIEQLPKNNDSDANKLAMAIDYIDSLSHSYLSHDELEVQPDNSDAIEVVTTQMFSDALQKMFEVEAMQKNIQLSFYPGKHEVFVEPLVVMRVMTNLISNALAHAHASRIVVGFRTKGSQVIFQVHDNGCGMDEELTPTLFELGAKGEHSEGQGLGLGIVNELCNAQGMAFSLRSKQGKGTSVCVTMQCATANNIE